MSLEKSANSFLMSIEDVFPLTTGGAQGVIVTGRVSSGTLRKGDHILITGGDKSPVLTTVTRFEGFIRDATSWVAQPGDNTFIFLGGIKQEQLEIGMVITKPVNN
jgi:translation elongation factor EF-Tu-like GTPase